MLGACVPRRAVWMRSEFYVTDMIAWIGSLGPSCRVHMSACFGFGLLLAISCAIIRAGRIVGVCFGNGSGGSAPLAWPHVSLGRAV